MKNKDLKQLARANDLLSQALNAAMGSMPNNRTVGEAKSHIKQAMSEIGSVQKKQMKKAVTETQFENWWNNLKGGAAKMANQPMSTEAAQRSLEASSRMEEEQSLEDIEKTQIKETNE